MRSNDYNRLRPQKTETILKKLYAILLALLILPVSTLWADALMVNQSMRSPTIAEFFIDENGVVVELEIGVQGAETFKNLLPDNIYQAMGYGQRPVAERLTEFFSRQLLLADENKQLLRGELVSIDLSTRTLRDSYNGMPLAVQDDAPEIIRAQLKYHFNDGPLPTQLGFLAPR